MLTGKSFVQMVVSAANHLENHRDEIDAMNVFPVPDGDTGKNMSLTMRGAAKAAEENAQLPLSEVARRVATGTLKSARGNSGVILSQLIRGLAKGMEGKESVSAADMGGIMREGVKSAYSAVMNPTEGTILTVSKAGAIGALRAARSETTIEGVLRQTVRYAKNALEKTPDMLPKLKEAGVVDAGGAGLVCILEGMLYYLEHGEVVPAQYAQDSQLSAPPLPQGAQTEPEEITFGYCTEFIIEKNSGAGFCEDFKKQIAPLGDCMLVIDDFEVVKVHIHTDHPGQVLEYALQLGSLNDIKIDNMRYQHNERIRTEGQAQSHPAPSAAVGSERKARRPYAIVSVASGEGLSHIMREMGAASIIEGGQTMNPSAGDILEAALGAGSDVIYVLPNNKNIILAAQQAAGMDETISIHVVPTASIPQGIAALTAFDAEVGVEENLKAMEQAARHVVTGQVTYAVRDSESDGLAIHEGDFMGIIDGKIKLTGTDVQQVAQRTAQAMCGDGTELVTLYYGAQVTPEAAQQLADTLEETLEEQEIEVSLLEGGQQVYAYILSAE